MFKHIIIFIFLLLFSIASFSQKFMQIEAENLSVVNNGLTYRPQMTVFGDSFKEDAVFGTFYFALVNEFWAEAYAGLCIRPASWAYINIGLGLEVDDNPFRIGGGILLMHNNITFHQIYEYGGSGFWYNVRLNYKLWDNFKAGGIFKRYYGVGPNFEFRTGKLPLFFDFAPLYDYEDENYKLMLIVRYFL